MMLVAARDGEDKYHITLLRRNEIEMIVELFCKEDQRLDYSSGLKKVLILSSLVCRDQLLTVRATVCVCVCVFGFGCVVAECVVERAG